jgi:shikimate kinase
MSRIFGVTNCGTIIEFGSLLNPIGKGQTPEFELPPELDQPEFWNKKKVTQKICNQLWANADSSFNGKHILVAIVDTTNYAWQSQPLENLSSLQLAVFMAPLSSNTSLNIQYSHIYFTGGVYCFDGILYTSRVIDCFKKYQGAVEHHNRYYPNESAVFMYTTDSDEEETNILNKEYSSNLASIRIHNDMWLNELIGLLTEKTIFQKSREHQFLAFLRDFLIKIVSKNKEILPRFTFYFSNIDNYHSIMTFKVFRELIEQNRPFSLNIFIPRPVIGSDIIRDDGWQSQPVWYQKMKQKHPQDAVGFNQKTCILQQRIQNECRTLEQLFYIKNDDPYIRLHIQYHEESNHPDALTADGENALLLEIGEDKFLAATSPQKLYLCEVSRTHDKEAISLIEKMEEIFNDKSEPQKIHYSTSKNVLLPKFILYGPPGVGKSTLTSFFAKKNDKKIIASDTIINDFIFADSDKKFYEVLNKNLNLNIDQEKWEIILQSYKFARYSRRIFEFDTEKEGKERRTEEMYKIRDIASEIAVRQAFATGDFCDLGGKELLSDRTKFLVKSLGFITVLLIPTLSKDDRHNKTSEQICDEEYEAYYQMYHTDHSLIDEKKRRNIFDYMVDASCYIYKDKIRPVAEIPEQCRYCRWNDNENNDYKSVCSHKVSKYEKWQRFHDRLKIDLWDKRYEFYRYKADIIIDRRMGIGKSIEKFADYIREEIIEFAKKCDEQWRNQ